MVLYRRIFLSLTLLLCLIRKSSDARELPTLFWNSSNSIFTDRRRFPIDEGDGSGAAYLEVNSMDVMDVVCPSYSADNQLNRIEELIIYQVSDLSFMGCECDSRSKVFLVCDEPTRKIPLAHRIVFRPFSPLPNGFEYQPGRSYYLISTSNGSHSGLNNTRMGLCFTHNMRLRIDVRPEQVFISPVPLKSEDSVISSTESRSDKQTRAQSTLRPAARLFSGRKKDFEVSSTQISNEMSTKKNGYLNGFAVKHGLNYDHLEYVLKMARDGFEGDLSFREIESKSSNDDKIESLKAANNMIDSIKKTEGDKSDLIGIVLNSINDVRKSEEINEQSWNSISEFIVQDYTVDDAIGATSWISRVMIFTLLTVNFLM